MCFFFFSAVLTMKMGPRSNLDIFRLRYEKVHMGG